MRFTGNNFSPYFNICVPALVIWIFLFEIFLRLFAHLLPLFFAKLLALLAALLIILWVMSDLRKALNSDDPKYRKVFYGGVLIISLLFLF